MSPYLLGDAAKLISPKSPPIYDLYAIVHHYGNSYIGHYVNTAKAPSSEGLGENYSEFWDIMEPRVYNRRKRVSNGPIPCVEYMQKVTHLECN